MQAIFDAVQASVGLRALEEPAPSGEPGHPRPDATFARITSQIMVSGRPEVRQAELDSYNAWVGSSAAKQIEDGSGSAKWLEN